MHGKLKTWKGAVRQISMVKIIHMTFTAKQRGFKGLISIQAK